MRNRLFVSLVAALVFAATITAAYAQKRPSGLYAVIHASTYWTSQETHKRPPGFYLVIDTCRACYYDRFYQDLTRALTDTGIRFVGHPHDPNPFIGPFDSMAAAEAALPSLVPALDAVQTKRNAMERPGGGWPLPEDKHPKQSEPPRFEYGIFDINTIQIRP